MSQRLGIAAAILGDPQVLIFDEPVNALDPEGIVWIRRLMQDLTGRGRTVFVSSPLMSEMTLTADHLIVIGRGRLLADVPTSDFIAAHSNSRTRVRTPQLQRLGELVQPDAVAIRYDAEALDIDGMTTGQIWELAAAHGITLHELSARTSSLAQAFMELTRDSVQYEADTALGGTHSHIEPRGRPPTRAPRGGARGGRHDPAHQPIRHPRGTGPVRPRLTASGTRWGTSSSPSGPSCGR